MKIMDKYTIRQNSFKLLPHKNMVVRYDCLPIRGTQYLTSNLGIEQGKRPDHVWVVLVLMLVRSLLAWTRLWSKHEMRAAELSDELESEVQASAVNMTRVSMRGSSSNFY